MIGSFLVMRAESREQILEIMNKDVYTLGGAWDMDNVRVILCGWSQVAT